MGNPNEQTIEFNKQKSQSYLKVIAVLLALLVAVLTLVFVVGIATLCNKDIYKISAYAFYIGAFIYTFRRIRKDQKS